MAARELAFPAHLFRRFLAPVAAWALGALLTATIARVLRRTREPALPKMSDEWLRSLDHHEEGAERWRLY